jgi:hypothetical protein
MTDDWPSAETLRCFIVTEWADLHHSRVQEWTALGVVAGVHLVVIQVVSALVEKHTAHLQHMLVLLASAIAVAFAVFGILITCRHRHLMKVKLNWIFQAEDKLGLIADDVHAGIIPRIDAPTERVSWEGLSVPRPLSTSGLIVGFYALLILVDILVPAAFWSLVA